jgi:hypothetical protein
MGDFVGIESSSMWKKFEAVAGDQTIFDELRNTKNSKRMLNELRSGSLKARGKSLINPKDSIRNLEDLIGITEQSTRFQNFKGIYEKSIKDGLGEEVALRKATQAALQNSVNFRRSGSVVKVANLLIPYFNAGIQGSRNVGRSLRARPVGTIAKAATIVGGLSALAVLWNYEDEERKRIYDNISETEKEDNYVFVLPGAKQREDGTYEGIIKLPKPQGYRELADPIRVAVEKFAGKEDTKSIGSMLKDMTSAFSGSVQTEDAGKFMSSFVPQALKPALQAHLNRDLYWGSATVPDYMVEGTDDPTKRAYKGTSGIARFIAKQLNVSPIQVEKTIVDTAGSLGRYGINAVDNLLAKQGVIPKEQIGGRSVINDFTRRITEARAIKKDESQMTDGQRYYDSVKKATEGLPKYLQDSWQSYNRSNKNFLGEELFEKNGQAKKQAKAAAYIEHPELFEIDKKIDEQGRSKGEPGNPLYDLSYAQALMVVQEKALPPGAKDEGLNTLYDQQWYSQFKNKESKFYEKIFGKGGAEESKDNPYPQRSKDLIKAMDYYYDLPSSSAKGAFNRANPAIASQMDDYYARKGVWTNIERAKLGLPPIEDKYAKYSSGSGSGNYSRPSTGGYKKSSTRRSSSRRSSASGKFSKKFDYKLYGFGKPTKSTGATAKSLRKLVESAVA